jgi:opacity protein-like surface antigen
MKKFISTGLLAISLIFCIQAAAFAQAQNNPRRHNARRQSKVKVGAGILYGNNPETAGLQITGTYRIQKNIELAPDVSIYFPGNNDTPYHGYWAINLNGHYIFAGARNYEVYGLAGLNITTVKYYNDFRNKHHTKLGINVGIGAEYHFQDFSLYGELKYVISKFDQLVLGVGVRVPIPTGSR